VTADVLPIDEITRVEEGKGISAKGRIPAKAEFFRDHFPDFPVLPGVLALEILKQTAVRYLEKDGPDRSRLWSIKSVRAVKFARYLKPGDEWESRLDLVMDGEKESEWKGVLLHGGETAVSAKLRIGNSRD
jgi:3-hydroxyacyl-[acyl-carrier-protein] dehydratase